eukprot:COSAG02_NODE_12626_length_1517_cov_4.714109_2_plen_282_part_01
MRTCVAPALLVVLFAAATAQAPELPLAVVCAAPSTGFCTACDGCCADYSEDECIECVAATCSVRHRCVVGRAGQPCNVCAECCDKPWLEAQHACNACVNATCAADMQLSLTCESYGTLAHPAKCSKECVESCWTSPFTAPCMHACTTNPTLLFVAVLLPYLGRMLVDFIWNKLKRDGLVCSTRKEAAEEQGDLVYSALEDTCLMNEAPRDDSWEQLSWLQRSQNLVPKYQLGQLVWVRDEPTVAWIRGEVQAHDNAGLPLVRPVIGRMKKYDCELTDNFELA